MSQAGTRALVCLAEDVERGPGVQEHAKSPRSGRPLAGFVAQLMVSVDSRLNPSRVERTRRAAALYAEAGRRA
ncbi:hypothetical protein ACLBXP_01175 [Methylobacterium sp. A54F]